MTSASPGPPLLLVEDEESIGALVRAYLEQTGYRITWVRSGEEALDHVQQLRPRLVILDVGLPGKDGFDVCRSIRARSDVPIVMLTSRSTLEERIEGFSVGADDYLSKPFSPRELIVRVRALLRRARSMHAPLGQEFSFDDGRLRVDTVRYEISVEGAPRDVTPSEYKLLLALAQYPGRAYSRLELINRVQGYDFAGYERTVDAHVKNLRRKIEPDAARPRYVQTVHGVGYRLSPNAA